MRSFRRCIILTGAVAALAAAFALSVLPAGLVPRNGGPCGRTLCNCAPQFDWNTDAHPHRCKTAMPQNKFMTFDRTQIAESDGGHVAFQLAFGAFTVPAAHSKKIVDVILTTEDRIPESIVAISSHTPEIFVPPPRA